MSAEHCDWSRGGIIVAAVIGRVRGGQIGQNYPVCVPGPELMTPQPRLEQPNVARSMGRYFSKNLYISQLSMSKIQYIFHKKTNFERLSPADDFF